MASYSSFVFCLYLISYFNFLAKIRTIVANAAMHFYNKFVDLLIMIYSFYYEDAHYDPVQQ